MAFPLSIMLLSSSMFFSNVMAMPVFDGRDNFLESYNLSNCSLISNITVPTFEPTSQDDDPMNKLMKPLSNCKQHLSIGDYDLLCQEVYEVILSISTCKKPFTSQLGPFRGVIDIKVRSDVCLGFKESGMTFRKAENFVSPVLKDRSICELMCKGKYAAVCKVLLWAKEVYSQLTEYLSLYPLSRFFEFMKEDNCTFSKSLVAPDFHDDDKSSDLINILMVHSKPCNDIITFEKPEAILCTALFRSLLAVSTCNLDILDDEEVKIEKEIYSDICRAFEDSENSLTVRDNDIITYLQSYLVCEGMCSGSTKSICQIILWAYEMEQELTVHPVVPKRLGAVSKEELKYNFTIRSEISDLTTKLKEEVAKALSGSPTIEKKILYSNLKVQNMSESSYEKVSYPNKKNDHGISENPTENEDVLQKTQFGGVINVSELGKSKTNDGNLSSSESKESRKSITSNKINKTPSFVTSATDSSTVKKENSEVLPELKSGKKNMIDFESSETEQAIYISTVAPLHKIGKTESKPIDSVIESVDSEKKVELDTSTVKPLSTRLAGQTTEIASVITASIASVTTERMRNIHQENDVSFISAFNTETSKDFPRPSKESPELDSPVAYDVPYEVNDQKAYEAKDQKAYEANDDKAYEENDQKTLEPTYKELEKSAQDQFIEQESSHFFLYFSCFVALVTGCYLLIHNKQKVIALIVEGGRHKRRRRPHSASYKKLDS